MYLIKHQIDLQSNQQRAEEIRPQKISSSPLINEEDEDEEDEEDKMTDEEYLAATADRVTIPIIRN